MDIQAATVFKIGKPDASGGELKIFRDLGDGDFSYYGSFLPGVREFRDRDNCVAFFKKPPVFSVGKSKDSDFPFIHPVANCPWAGISKNPPTLKIEFDTPGKNCDYYLKIGIADTTFGANSIGIKVKLNGHQILEKRTFYRNPKDKLISGFSGALKTSPKAKNTPAQPIIKPVKYGLFKSDGTKNILEITPIFNEKVKNEQWFVYDFLELSDDHTWPEIADPRATLLDRAIRAMGTENVVFCIRGASKDGHWYANIGNYSYAEGTKEIEERSNKEVFSRLGGKLVLFNLRSQKYKLLIDDPKGGVRDPQMSYDGKKILFSYRKGDDCNYNLYEIDVSGKNLKKLPIATKSNDIEPCYLPNGDIVFTSDRLNKVVQCWLSPVTNLFRWFKSDNMVRCLSGNPDVDNSPQVLDDGRIIYMRWDYNHRSQMSFHHLWTINPDGSNDMIYLGNSRPGGLFIDAKQMPDEDGVVFTCAPGHGLRDHAGAIARAVQPFDPSDPHAFEILPSFGSYKYSFFDPYPLKGRIVLANTYNNIVIMDEGTFISIPIPPELMVPSIEDFGHHVGYGTQIKGGKLKMIARNVQPLTGRPKQKIKPDNTDYTKDTASVFLQDVYQGRKMGNVKKGSIKKLMLTEVMPTPVHYHGGLYPTSILGGFAIERVLGTVPVYEDGSAFFEVPASRAIAFVALDENGNSVKRMQSFAIFPPGTATSCIGCHEFRTDTPAPHQKLPQAYKKGISKIEKIDGAPTIIDYSRHIQPIFDKNCVPCHNGRDMKGGLNLEAGVGLHFVNSYVSLAALRQFVSDNNLWGNQKPYTFGSGASKIMDKAEGRHHNKKLAQKELNVLRAWLDTGAPMVSSYASNGTGFAIDALMRADRIMFDPKNSSMYKLRGKCMQCHYSPKNGRAGVPVHMVFKSATRINVYDKNKKLVRTTNTPWESIFNVTYPEKSTALMIGLTKSAGGHAEGEGKKSHPILFKDKSDPLYAATLKELKDLSKRMSDTYPFQTDPKFRPSFGFLKAMQKCGILPPDWDFKTPIDAMEADEKYFKWIRDNYCTKVPNK